MSNVESVTANDGYVEVDNTDPVNPVVSLKLGMVVVTVAPGAGITIDDTNPGEPIINLSLNTAGGLSGNGADIPFTMDYPTSTGYNFLPTLTNVTNISSSAQGNCQWMRVGDLLTVSGKVLIDAASTGPVELQMTIPVASAFEDDASVSGTAVCSESGVAAAISGNPQTHKACLKFQATTTSMDTYFFSYTYIIF